MAGGLKIAPDDEVARSVIYAKQFDGLRPSAKKMIPFDDSKSRAISVFWRRRCKSNADINGRGCKIAAKKNNDQFEKYGHYPPSGPKRAYYCGYVQGKRCEIEANETDWSTRVYQLTEDGDSAHAHIQLDTAVTDEHDLSEIMLEASMHVAKAMRSAREYRCPCDQNDRNHPKDAIGEGYLTGWRPT